MEVHDRTEHQMMVRQTHDLDTTRLRRSDQRTMRHLWHRLQVLQVGLFLQFSNVEVPVADTPYVSFLRLVVRGEYIIRSGDLLCNDHSMSRKEPMVVKQVTRLHWDGVSQQHTGEANLALNNISPGLLRRGAWRSPRPHLLHSLGHWRKR